jgi:hypothetical protein
MAGALPPLPPEPFGGQFEGDRSQGVGQRLELTLSDNRPEAGVYRASDGHGAEGFLSFLQQFRVYLNRRLHDITLQRRSRTKLETIYIL